MFFSPWVFNHFNILCGNFNIANFGYILTFRDKPSNFNSLPLKLCSKLMVDAISRWWAGKLKAISNCKWKRTQRKPNFNLYILLHLLKAFGPTSSSPSDQPLLSGSQMLWIEKSLTKKTLNGLSLSRMLRTLHCKWAVPPSWAVTFVTRLLSKTGPSATGIDGRKSGWFQFQGSEI